MNLLLRIGLYVDEIQENSAIAIILLLDIKKLCQACNRVDRIPTANLQQFINVTTYKQAFRYINYYLINIRPCISLLIKA